MIIDAPIKPITRTGAPAKGRPLKLRLSDRYRWAHEFTAASPETLRDGCFDAWVSYLVERARRRDERFPPHQTINRKRFDCAWPPALKLNVFDENYSMWINANYGTDSAKIVTVAQPGTKTAHEWNDEPWEMFWLRCLRCWDACYRLNKFLGRIPKMLSDGSDGEKT